MIRNDKADIIFRKGYEQAIKDGKKICEACATKGYYVREARKELLRDVEKIIDEFDILKYIDVEWFKDNWKEGLKQSLKELGEK